jgi:predicted adenylyl cyclase CyaB
MKENEAKIKLNDLSIIEKAKLNLVKEVHVLDIYFDNELNEFKNNDKVLRLRKENDNIMIAYKGPREKHDNLIVREEIETKVSSFEKALLIINNLNFKEKAKAEKIRKYFSYDKFPDLIITIDKYPFIGNYLEIEGKENEVNQFLKDFNFNKTIQKNCSETFIDYCKENNLQLNETMFTFEDEINLK